MPIDRVQLPNGDTEEVRDSRVPGIDSAPTPNSANLVTSGGVATALIQAVAGLGVAIEGKEDVSNKVTSLSSSSTNTQYPSAKCVYDGLAGKQSTLVSGTNIKTINNESLLGSGNITIQGGSAEALTTAEINTIWDTVME